MTIGTSIMSTTSDIRTVGVIGAGRMGQPIIGHLVRKGFAVVVHDIDEGKREAVATLGAGWAAGPRRDPRLRRI